MIADILAAVTAVTAAQASEPPAIVAVSPAPPPPIVSVNVAPPAVVAPRIATPIRVEQQPAVPIEVRITAGDRLLFSDTLRVARGSGASYSENRNEASTLICPDVSSYERSERSSLSVNLYWQESGNGSPGVNLSVNWTRAEGAGGCSPVGSRGVQLTQLVRLAPGESATVRGDAGLVVRLTRR